jgi:hypothetical protein
MRQRWFYYAVSVCRKFKRVLSSGVITSLTWIYEWRWGCAASQPLDLSGNVRKAFLYWRLPTVRTAEAHNLASDGVLGILLVGSVHLNCQACLNCDLNIFIHAILSCFVYTSVLLELNWNMEIVVTLSLNWLTGCLWGCVYTGSPNSDLFPIIGLYTNQISCFAHNGAACVNAARACQIWTCWSLHVDE